MSTAHSLQICLPSHWTPACPSGWGNSLPWDLVCPFFEFYEIPFCPILQPIHVPLNLHHPVLPVLMYLMTWEWTLECGLWLSWLHAHGASVFLLGHPSLSIPPIDSFLSLNFIRSWLFIHRDLLTALLILFLTGIGSSWVWVKWSLKNPSALLDVSSVSDGLPWDNSKQIPAQAKVQVYGLAF